MKPPRTFNSGLVLLDAVVGLALMGTLTLTLAYMFKSAQISSVRSAREIIILTNARKALNGDASFKGLVADSQYSAKIATAAASYLVLIDSLGVSTTYSLLSSGSLASTRQSVTTTRAKELSTLALAYYGVGSDYKIYETTVPANGVLVTASVSLSRLGQSVSFFSGGSLRNRP